MAAPQPSEPGPALPANLGQKVADGSVQRVSTGEAIPLGALFEGGGVAILVLSRHIGKSSCSAGQRRNWGTGEPAQLRGPIVAGWAVDAVQVAFITMGNTLFIRNWLDSTRYPPERVFLDQQGLVYKKLEAKRGVWNTFTPAMWFGGTYRRLRDGGLKSAFKRAMASWKLTKPKQSWQSWQQGGVLVLKGPEVHWSFKSSNPGDYPCFSQVIAAAVQALGPAPGGSMVPNPPPHNPNPKPGQAPGGSKPELTADNQPAPAPVPGDGA